MRPRRSFAHCRNSEFELPAWGFFCGSCLLMLSISSTCGNTATREECLMLPPGWAYCKCAFTLSALRPGSELTFHGLMSSSNSLLGIDSSDFKSAEFPGHEKASTVNVLEAFRHMILWPIIHEHKVFIWKRLKYLTQHFPPNYLTVVLFFHNIIDRFPHCKRKLRCTRLFCSGVRYHREIIKFVVETHADELSVTTQKFKMQFICKTDPFPVFSCWNCLTHLKRTHRCAQLSRVFLAGVRQLNPLRVASWPATLWCS